MGARIVAAGTTPAGDPSLVIAATAARQAATPTARLAARIAERRGTVAGGAATAAGGSFHGGVAQGSSTFVKPGFTVAF